MAVKTYTKSGTKATMAATLNKSVFGVEPKNHTLLQQAYQTYLANGRDNLATTKKRGEVRGGGKKPWRQKGTGRARFGSSRNPIWRGGGIVFGPSGEENYSKSLNTKAKRLAIRQALSLAAKSDKIKVVEALVNLDGKTKDLAAFLKKIEASGRVLAVVNEKDATKQQAVSNIQDLKVSSALYQNVYDILNADTIVIEKPALSAIENWLGGSK